MKINRIITKSKKYLLANYNGIEIHLSVPNKESKEQKYYLDYKFGTQKKYYGNGSVKKKSIEFFSSLNTAIKMTQAQIESDLKELFKQDLEIIAYELQMVSTTSVISMRTGIHATIEGFYAFKCKQMLEGTVEKRTLINYGQHHRKLLCLFKTENYKNFKLIDLSSDFWINYRIDVLNSKNSKNQKKLQATSVNQHFQYITQYYGWLIDYLELPIKNHLRKLNKLSEAKQNKRFKIIPQDLFAEFYDILENKEKYTYTRLYLCGLLLYENNIRLSEQVLIRLKDISLERGHISILNKKNDSIRTVLMSEKVNELITIICNNTLNKGIPLSDEMYLFGGHNVLKSGKPHSYKELGTLMRRFRQQYPQFVNITLYEQKHTSITNQFDDGIDHYVIKERANHSSISTTEIYLQSNRAVKPYELKERKTV